MSQSGAKRQIGRVAFWALCCLPTWATFISGAEIYSNGKGGGPWSDPATWRGKTVPSAEDDVVIARADEVLFDRNDDKVALPETCAAVFGTAWQPGLGSLHSSASLLAGATGKTSCRKLFVDPKGLLNFKTGGGKQVLCVAGPIEVFGTIKIDGHASANDFLELRLVGDTAEKRTLRLKKGGALLLSGAGRRRNAALTSWVQPRLQTPATDPETLGTVQAEAASMIDLQRGEIVNVYVSATSIDNTGAKANERLNVAESHFRGRSRLLFVSCDTPLIVNNLFDCGEASIGLAAIHVYASPLAEIRGNTIRGQYSYGIQGTAQTDSVVSGNTVEKATGGIYWYGENGMITQTMIRGCDTGVALTSMSGAMDDVTIEGAKVGLYHAGATAQVTSLRVIKPAKDGVAIDYYSGPLTLLNCNIRPEQIRVAKPAAEPKPPEFLVQSMQYLIVRVKGDLPADTQVEVVTANPAAPLAAGAVDLNVRNSPAPVGRNGLTPLPKSLEPLVLKSWTIDGTGKTLLAPEYTIKVLGQAGGAKGERPVLKTVKAKPEDHWARDKPNDPAATLEVPLK